MLAVFDVWAKTASGAQFTGKVNVVPQTGSLTIAPIAISTIVNVTEGDADHEGAILQEPRLGVLYEPHPGVKVIYDLLAPNN